MDLKDYGFSDEMISMNSNKLPARVTAVHKNRFVLICMYGEISGKLKTKEYYNENEKIPTTGDFVLINYIEGGESLITATLPRRTFFSRGTVSRDKEGHTKSEETQVIAANFDYVFIMQSLNQDFNIKRLERYLTLAWSSGALPVIILTKADLAENNDEYINKAINVASGTPVHAVSSKTGLGLDALSEYLKPGKTAVFLGSSGVGKSSLVNALAGEEVMAVSGIREDDGKGRHTTTHRQLIMLKSGVMIIDTPGMRELGIEKTDNNISIGLENAFSDVESYLGKCKYSDCTHTSEPGCAIREAIEKGELNKERYESYCSLKKNLIILMIKPHILRKRKNGIRIFQK